MQLESEPSWLSRKQVDHLHEVAIEIAGGSFGVRDEDLLESALSRPKNMYAYGERDIFQLAACYAEGASHAFIDGNKRTAFLCADRFLTGNGIELQPANDSRHYEMMVDLVNGKVTREQAAEHFRANSKPLTKEKNISQEQKKEGQDKPRRERKPRTRGRER